MKLYRYIFLFLFPYTLIHPQIINPETISDTSRRTVTNDKKEILEIGARAFLIDWQVCTLVSPEVFLPIKNKNLSNNQKQVANYLFLERNAYANNQSLDFLQNLALLPIREYQQALSFFTPEIYGALPLNQNQTIYYLTSLLNTPYRINEKNRFTVLPFYHTSYGKEKFLPKYQHDTTGFSINTSHYTTFFTPGIGLTYGRSDAVWQDEKGQATTLNIYLYPSMNFHKENLFCNVTVLGGFTYHNVMRTMQFANEMQINVNPHSWELATALCGGYNCSTDYLTFIPQLKFTQINVFQSSIKENRSKDMCLKTASKNFRYLNMSFSLQIERSIIHSCYCITPSLQFGWHNTRLLSDTNFISKISGYMSHTKDFRTETYSGNTSLYFLEGAIGLSDGENNSLLLSYKTEFDTRVITSGLSAQIIWEF